MLDLVVLTHAPVNYTKSGSYSIWSICSYHDTPTESFYIREVDDGPKVNIRTTTYKKKKANQKPKRRDE